MSDETETMPADETPADETSEEVRVIRSLPEIVEIYGSARDPHTRHLRRSARFPRRAFRIGGIYLIRPGRRFDMTLQVVREHAEEILERARAGQLQIRHRNRPFRIEELEHALLSEKADDPIAEKLHLMADLAAKLGSPPPEGAVAEAIEEARGYEGEELEEFLAQVDEQLDEMRQALAAKEGAESKPEDASPADTPTEPPAEPTGEEPVTEPTDAGATEVVETPTEPAPAEEGEEPSEEEGGEDEEDEEDGLIPSELRLPENFERMKKDDLVDLFVEREDYGLTLPEPKTGGKPPTNDQLVEALTEWALSVEFDDEAAED